MSRKSLVAGLIIGLLVGVTVGIFSTGPNPTNQHYPLYTEIYDIKDRITIKITEPNFTNPERICDWYELREEDSGDYNQTTVNFWVFQHG